MTENPNVSLRPVVDAIETLLKELGTEEVRDPQANLRKKALLTSLEGVSLLLRAECWSSAAGESVYEFPA